MKALLDLAVPAITFLLLFAVGLDLAPADFARVRRQPRVLTAGLLGPLLVLPPLALLLIALFRPPADVQAGLFLVAACPIGGISNTYSYLAGASTALSATLTAASSLLAIITIPALALLFGAALGHSLGIAVPLPLIFAQLLLMLALPVAAGMLVRFRRPALASRSQPYVRAFGFGGPAVADGTAAAIRSACCRTTDHLVTDHLVLPARTTRAGIRVYHGTAGEGVAADAEGGLMAGRTNGYREPQEAEGAFHAQTDRDGGSSDTSLGRVPVGEGTNGGATAALESRDQAA